MIKQTSSKLLLKKVISQNSIPSSLQSNPSVQSWKRTTERMAINDVGKACSDEVVSYRREGTLDEELKLQSRVNNNELKLQSRVKHELKLQSRMACENRFQSRINNMNQNQAPMRNNQIQCLQIQSRIVPPFVLQQPSITQLPLECLESKILTHKLKVHSSIDGLESSKQSQPNSQSHKQNSLPISDLIITDNKYMKRSNGLNQHDTFSLAQQEEFLKVQIWDNMKVLKKQLGEQIDIIERELEMIQRDEMIEKVKVQMQRIEQAIQSMRHSDYMSVNTPLSVNSPNISSRNRSKTPQIGKRKLKAVKSQQHIKPTLLSSPTQQQLLQHKITQQKQKSKQHKQASLKTIEKLSKAKSAYKHLELQLNFYENLNHQNIQYQRGSNPMTPKSPLKPNYKTKYYQFLEKEKATYYDTLKKHAMVICREIETMNVFGEQRCEELMQEIQLIRGQIRYLDTKGIEKFFFVQPIKNMNIHNNNRDSRDKSNKHSTFKNNYSQKLISTYSAATSLHSAIPPLSPRTPYPQPPQLYSQSPNPYSKSPRLKSRSPNIYERSPHYSAMCITPRAIRVKDMNKMSQKSTNHSQTRISKPRNDEQNRIREKRRDNNSNKENIDLKRRNEYNSNRSKRKDILLINGKKTTIVHNNNELIRNSKRKAFTNKRSDGEMRTQPSDEYCINSENQFRF